MRQLFIFFIILISCGQTKSLNVILTGNKWTIQKIENINLGKIAPQELNEGTLWTFDEDNTFSLEAKNDFANIMNRGTWALSGSNLTLTYETDTTLFIIDKLTDSSFICTIVEGDSLRITLIPSMDK